MSNYIDGFVLPIPKNGLNTYKEVVEKVAEIWKEHGALSYSEFFCEDSGIEGVRSFDDAANTNKDEVTIFGWVEFESLKRAILQIKKVAADPRLAELIEPLTKTSRPIFDAERMIYGGFKSLV